MSEDMQVRIEKLPQLQALPLEAKVQASERRIREWYDHWNGDVSISFSGGKDSTVLLHLVRSIYPDVPAVYADTGLEFPEVRDFVRSIPNVIWVKPKLDFLSVVQKYGYPVVSKRVAQYVGEVQRAKGDTATRRLRLTGIRGDGTASPMGRISNRWQFLCEAPFKISDKCCKYLKKDPMDSCGSHPYVGTMAADGNKREQSYYLHGCNAFSLDRPRSAPMSFWTEADVWEYIRSRSIPYSRIYDLGYARTGCMFCMFGLHLEGRPNRFDRMQQTHPQLFDWCMFGPLNLFSVISHTYRYIPDLDHTSNLRARKEPRA